MHGLSLLTQQAPGTSSLQQQSLLNLDSHTTALTTILEINHRIGEAEQPMVAYIEKVNSIQAGATPTSALEAEAYTHPSWL